jgi:hypothetical protein
VPPIVSKAVRRRGWLTNDGVRRKRKRDQRGQGRELEHAPDGGFPAGRSRLSLVVSTTLMVETCDYRNSTHALHGACLNSILSTSLAHALHQLHRPLPQNGSAGRGSDSLAFRTREEMIHLRTENLNPALETGHSKPGYCVT